MPIQVEVKAGLAAQVTDTGGERAEDDAPQY